MSDPIFDLVVLRKNVDVEKYLTTRKEKDNKGPTLSILAPSNWSQHNPT